MNEWLDSDGYPTEQALNTIESWARPSKELMEFIRPLWNFANMDYWREETYIDDFTGRKETRYYLSTAGWSGNEDIIVALKNNLLFWSVCWVQSRRGGHYIFETREIK